jgi:hypothetical protein
MKYISQPFKKTVKPEQYENAKKHWTKLIAGEISGAFHMLRYTKAGAGQEYGKLGELNPMVCGTSACSAGYIPETLQIPHGELKAYITDGFFRLDFRKIVRDYLGIAYGDAYRWCFDAHWGYVDDSAKGAGIRMRILYENGLPENWTDQQAGAEPLMYLQELPK